MAGKAAQYSMAWLSMQSASACEACLSMTMHRGVQVARWRCDLVECASAALWLFRVTLMFAY